MARKKLPVALTAVISAVAVLLSGTLAWQSVSQTALNEGADVVNPGGRLHDDFNGENKDVYVENFAEEPILARLRLSEFLAFTHNRGIDGVEAKNVKVGQLDANGNREYETHIFGADNTADAYWHWLTGGETVYLPTFNRNKDSLLADVNGTFAGPDGTVTDDPDDDRYQDYRTYTLGQEVGGTEIYDADGNDVDELGSDFDQLDKYVAAGNIALVDATHTAEQTLSAQLIDMESWLELVERDGGYDEEKHGGYWVYDSDGWVYWSALIRPHTATGLLLDGIALAQVMDNSWYYAIEVTAQFVTPDDTGKSDATGFYDPQGGAPPSPEAEQLLALITGAEH